jgi:oxygen-dependent protoporphyrinogen oxidase
MERTHGSLVRALFAKPPAGAPSRPSKLLSFDQGMGVLISALARRLGPAITTGVPVCSLARRDDAWQLTTAAGEVIDADRVVLAVPARQAAAMVQSLDGELGAALSAFEYAGLVVVALAYRTTEIPRPLDGYGYLTTRPEGLATLGVAWESSLFPGRSPEGMVLLRVMLGGSRRPDLVEASASEAVAVARAELKTVLGISAAPAHVAVNAWPNAIAQYTLGHQQRCRGVQTMAARHPGLWLCGTSYDGVAFNDGIKSGRLTAGRVAEQTWGAGAWRAEPDLDAAEVRV